MSRYIDADKLTVYFEALAKQAEMEGLYNMAHIHNRCLQIIEDAPTADVVEVVRCKDCKYFVDEDEMDMLGLCTCKRIAIAYNGELYPERDFYCPYGERSENGK